MMVIPMMAAACGGSPAGDAQPAGLPARHVELTHVPRGEADLSLDPASGTLTVAISVTGLAPDSIHPAHLHRGSCGQPGPALYPLSPVSANPTGMATDRVSTLPRVREHGIPAAGWYVDLHNGPGSSPGAEVQPIVCGDVVDPGRATSVTVPLTAGPPGTADQAAGGGADLSAEGGRLRLVVSVRGLSPSSGHAVHLHRGSCQAQSGDLAALPVLRADAAGAATETAEVAGSTGIQSHPTCVIVYRVESLAAQGDSDPILCGDLGG